MQKCSTCRKEPPKPGQRVCKSCHANYMREHRKVTRKKLITRCKTEGATLMRSSLIEKFQRLGLKEMNGVTAAEIIRTAKPPMFPVEPLGESG